MPDDTRPVARPERPPADDESAKSNDTGHKAAQRDEADGKDGPKKAGPLRNPLVIGALVVVALIVVVGGLLWWLEARRWQATDDAYVDGHIVHLAPQVSGIVVKLYVSDNADVRGGELLADIDSSDAQARVDQAKAQIAQVQAQIGQQHAQVAAAEATLQQARADAAGAAAQAQEAADDLARYRRLQALSPAAVSAQQMDQALATARNTAAQRDSASKKALNAAQQVRAAEAAEGGFAAQLTAAQAQAQQSQITLGDTHLYAPVDGHVAKFNVAPGDYVQPGQELMAIVPTALWITANFKETQLDLMRVGQHAEVRVDACPSAPLSGHVDSIQRGAGQAFALLPPENATGNFVKVVQRVPVKIVLDNVPRDCPLGPGLSVAPRVLVRP
jgi:membrane fusion protein (multidrug efflux system)